MSARTICEVIDYGGPTGGSFIPAMESLTRALTERGDRCVFLAHEVHGATWPADLMKAGATVHLVQSDREVVDGLRMLCPEIVHSHFNRFDLAAVHGAPHSRIIWHVHSHRNDRSFTSRIRAFAKYRLLGRRMNAIVAVSRFVAQECVAWCAPRERVRVLENGIDTHRFHPPAPAERAEARAKFHFADSDRVVLFFERVPYKGGATLREAMRSTPGFRVLVVGGTQEDRDRFGDAPRVISIQRLTETRLAYWAADALAFASDDHEAFPFVLLEGLACGVPVAAANIPVVQQVCAGVDSVVLFPVGDGEALAHALGEAMTRSGDQAGRERIVKAFGLDRWTADMLRLYDSS
ncbi:glycosyltransferase [bacterium]|nr:MAG: glycosyltransferase [bacterium]